MNERADEKLEVIRYDVKGPGAPLSDYSSVVSVKGGRILFISGKGPVDADGKTVDAGDAEAQVRQALANMEAALKVAGARLSDVVKVNAYFTRKECFPEWRKIRLELFPREFPASTAVLVPALAIDDWMVEIEAYAAVPAAN